MRAVIGLTTSPGWDTKLQGIIVAMERGRMVPKVSCSKL